MKKLIALFLVLVFALAVLASCGNGGEKAETSEETADNDSTGDASGDESSAPASTDDQKKDEPEQQSIVPDKDKRSIVYDYMVSMSQVKWTPTGNIDTTDIAKTLKYTKGVEYEGLPYINLDVDTDLEEFMEVLRWDEAKQKYYYDETERNKILGNDCSSSILLSWKLIDGNITATTTHSMLPLGKNGVYAVGDYNTLEDERDTKKIIAKNGETVMANALAQLKKGDAVLWHESAGHVRMIVEDPVVKYRANGDINTRTSSITTIEQTNAMDSQRTDGVKTTWYVNHTYTFKDLIDKGYIPVTCAALMTEEYEPQTIKTSSLNTKKTMANTKTLSGEVTCNYSIQKVFVKVAKSDGTVIFEYSCKPRNSLFKVSTVNYKLPSGGLEKGDYVYSITILTACGEFEAYRLEFTKE